MLGVAGSKFEMKQLAKPLNNKHKLKIKNIY